MRNILFITNSVSFGGASKMICFVAESLAARGHKVVIVNLKATENVTDFERSVESVEVDKVAEIPEGKNRHIYRIQKIKEIAKNKKIDVIIGFTSFPNMYAVVVGKLLHIPSIISERGDPARTIGTSLKDKLMTFLINRASGGVFQTDGAMAFYGKGLQKRGQVIPNPIFIKGAIPAVEFWDRKKTVVSVGRLDNEQKRLDIMLQAFKLFHENHPEYILKLYGRGTQENEIRQWTVELGISEYVRFMGLTTQPMQDIAMEGMFLITSDYEGISNSLLEAMAVGLPCVSTDHTPGGARLLIQDHENGLLAPIGNAEKLAIAMSDFADNPSLAEKCGNNARNVVNRFNPERIINMWEDYINKACG